MNPKLAKFLVDLALSPGEATAFKEASMNEKIQQAKAAGLNDDDAAYAAQVVHGVISIESELPPSQATQTFKKIW